MSSFNFGCHSAMRCGKQSASKSSAIDTDVDAHLSDALVPFLGAAKKSDAGAVRFVAPGPPGRVRVQRLAIPEILAAARPVRPFAASMRRA